MTVRDTILASLTIVTSACGPARPSEQADTGTETQVATEDDSSNPDESESGEPTMDVASTWCDPWSQDCPEGEKCVPYASSGGTWDANKCVPIMGDQALGEPCSYGGITEGTDDCDASGMCWNVQEVDGEMLGTCMPFCQGSPDAPMCPQEYYCPIAGDGSVNVCIPECDPVEQDCDLPETACYWTGSWFACVSTTQDIPIGEPCGFINDCVSGHTCINAEVIPDCEGSACCTAFCDISLGDAQCADLPGTACVSFWEEGTPPPEYSHVGICIAS